MKIEKGIILSVDYEYSPINNEEMYLRLDIKMYSWGLCTMIFKDENKIKQLLRQFHSKDIVMKISELIHKEVVMLPNPKGWTNVPIAIAHLSPLKFESQEWIYNDNEREYLSKEEIDLIIKELKR